MRDVPFVDAHIHLWDLRAIHYPWLTPPFTDDGPNGSVEAIARDYHVSDYRADAAGWNVVGAVHVDAGADAPLALEETRWLEGLALSSGLPSGIVAFAALHEPGIEQLLEAQAAHPHVRGIRHIVNWHHEQSRSYTLRDFTADPDWECGFALLGRYGLSFDLQAYPNQFSRLALIASRHPDIQIVINHMGMPVETDRHGPVQWLTGMRALADRPNVAVKISGAGFIHRPWTQESVRSYVLGTIDLFGPERCMFASDFPTDKLFGSFDHTLSAYAELIADFSETERRAMWGGNANRIYRLGLDLEGTQA
jgi:predicted TIM-barrel fold metal-dependent hydrolase